MRALNLSDLRLLPVYVLFTIYLSMSHYTYSQEVSTLGEVHAAIRVGDWTLILNEWYVGTYDEDINDQLSLDK